MGRAAAGFILTKAAPGVVSLVVVPAGSPSRGGEVAVYVLT